MALVFIDLDGTLIEKKSSERLFFFFLMRKKMLRLPQIVSFLSFSIRFLPRYGNCIWKKNKAYLDGLSEREITRVAEEFTRKHLLTSIRRNMKDRISRHRGEGDETILLTGSLSPIAGPVAGFAGIDTVSATVCATRNGRFESLPPVSHPFHVQKYRIAGDFCRKRGFPLRDCTAYGDSIHDLPLLEAVRTPVAVHPDRRLRKIARLRSWEILDDSP